MLGRLFGDCKMNEELEDEEDAKDLAIAEKRLADIKAGRTKTIPIEEVMNDSDEYWGKLAEKALKNGFLGDPEPDESRTDWPRIEAMKDEEIDLTDSPELDAAFFREAKEYDNK